ncbi:tRNA1(Val) (adenine(37)-N6)-methyltransferase [Cohnella terricola]|uniref:tRNA1(Val) (Adenine(37)-N6)-methyltransferase n=1 Tax=Cohnella terricola TaxID=1289167 RepID=A0A559J7C2_9BACL|nr:tRNA1(Val) (adenine(37)-N6)-methyltransferase [Cohnella terricola]TVX95773.1 tRNA1(Val) (adenine(37)-N6)-methyltransferase [Cohnella terricola]
MSAEEYPLRPGERLDDLLTHHLKIIQSSEVFSFSLDAVLLARFASVSPRGRILDLCTGNGVIPMLLTTRTEATIDGIEIQPRLADMARRSVELNGLNDRVHIIEGDLREWKPEGELYDAVTVNPPYLPVTSGDRKENIHQAMARHEIGCKLEDVVAACARSVRVGGRVAMVHRPSRLVDIIDLMRRYRIEPKRIRFVHPRKEAEANMILIEGTLGGKPEVRLLPPLIVYEEDGEYTQELLAVFYGQAAELPDFKRQNGRAPSINKQEQENGG